MKKPVVFLLLAPTEASTTGLFLTRFGFEVKTFDQMSHLISVLGQKKPGLLLLDGEILSHAALQMKEAFSALVTKKSIRVILTGVQGGEAFPFPHDVLDRDLDPIGLHAFLGGRLHNYSRNHLRVETNLPGLVSRKENCQFCEILDLGMGGAFIRTGTPLSTDEASIHLHIPLLGLKKELELHSRIVYQVRPSEENNYLQGAGVSFTAPEGETLESLKDYLVYSLKYEGLGGAFGLTSSAALGSFRSESKGYQGGRERRLATVQ